MSESGTKKKLKQDLHDMKFNCNYGPKRDICESSILARIQELDPTRAIFSFRDFAAEKDASSDNCKRSIKYLEDIVASVPLTQEIERELEAIISRNTLTNNPELDTAERDMHYQSLRILVNTELKKKLLS